MKAVAGKDELEWLWSSVVTEDMSCYSSNRTSSQCSFYEYVLYIMRDMCKVALWNDKECVCCADCLRIWSTSGPLLVV